jgi:hypothetical protein
MLNLSGNAAITQMAAAAAGQAATAPALTIPVSTAGAAPQMAAGGRPASPSPILDIAAPQEAAVDAALEQLSALASLADPDGPIVSLDGIKARRSVH